jgi:DNA-binding response OmpR family regulator
VDEGKRAARVLIADDDVDILALVAFRLERSGYQVLKAMDGEEALKVALEESPDLAVLDVMMPRMDGYEVTRRIRGNEATRGMSVILLTARAQDSDVAAGLEAGADDYVKKPFSPQELRTRVEQMLARP